MCDSIKLHKNFYDTKRNKYGFLVDVGNRGGADCCFAAAVVVVVAVVDFVVGFGLAAVAVVGRFSAFLLLSKGVASEQDCILHLCLAD